MRRRAALLWPSLLVLAASYIAASRGGAGPRDAGTFVWAVADSAAAAWLVGSGFVAGLGVALVGLVRCVVCVE
jgi:hypothetical protein